MSLSETLPEQRSSCEWREGREGGKRFADGCSADVIVVLCWRVHEMAIDQLPYLKKLSSIYITTLSPVPSPLYSLP